MTFVPGNAAGLLAEFGSPLYVYDASLIEQALHRFRQAFPYDPLECYFAIVCNKNHFIARLLSTLGVGVHANTPGDAFAALRAGVPRDAIRYSGTNLSGSDFDWLADHGIHHLNLDSLDQLRDWTARRPQAGIGLRLLVDDEQSTNRIGVTPAEVAPALEMCRQSGARLTGLHMYAGTNTLRAGRFLDCLDRLIACSEMLPDLEYIDLGGGFGVAAKRSTTWWPRS
jgi:diaminopimelate decarboxylase